MPTTDVALVEFTDIPSLPEATPIQPTWLFLVQDNVSGAVWRATSSQAKTVLVPVITALPQPLAATFEDFVDTNLGGSVRLVPATGVPIPDYRYKVGTDGNYVAVPSDGVITVGNISGQIFAFAVDTPKRQQSPTASSPAFSSYIVPVDPATVVTTPTAPGFANFRDTNAGGSVQLVAAEGVPMADYRYKVGTDGFYVAVPADGIITVGNVDGQVFAYSIAVAGRNPSATSASPTFTSYVATPTGTTTPPPPAFISFIDTNAGGSVQVLAATGIPMSDYLYKVASDGLYQPVPSDGLITVGNIAGPVYAYAVASGTRNQSQIGLSASFTAYTAPATVNQPPTINAFSVSPLSGTQGQSVSFSASAADSDGTVSLIYIYEATSAGQPGPIVATINGASGVVSLTPAAGSHEYYARAVDNLGLKGPEFGARFTVAITATAPAPDPTPAPAPTYNTILTGPSASPASGQPGAGITLTTAGAADVLRFNNVTGGSTIAQRMNLSIAGTVVAAVDFPTSYLGTGFSYTPVGGTLRSGVFTNGTVTI